ncbi:small subunit ribosomal protein S27e [Angomonas deanei]|uniref:Uncharacterized protein n=1 Tax=Angomonas deanei TaxID=59799 RepID=A0A7G2CTL2_9TRYP|nr:small subunit ribosomal protein S27e [Angomonas deanei]CAD2222274.1 hypothetical protein, conserved [Angomonas deanei]|eukprot:EPY40106.1 small subunit ribosomal protein S27e [Angomonas deanei]
MTAFREIFIFSLFSSFNNKKAFFYFQKWASLIPTSATPPSAPSARSTSVVVSCRAPTPTFWMSSAPRTVAVPSPRCTATPPLTCSALAATLP